MTNVLGIRSEDLKSEHGGRKMTEAIGARREHLKSKQRKGERKMSKTLGMRWLVVAAGEVDPILWTGIGAS